jgi:(+)-pinoresinol hydroxylase
MNKPEILFWTIAAGIIASPCYADPQADAGKAVFQRWCSGCHEPAPGHGFDPPAGTYRLQLKYNGSVPAALEQRNDLSSALIRQLVRSGVNMMPRTRKTEISDKDLDALVVYLTAKK